MEVIMMYITFIAVYNIEKKLVPFLEITIQKFFTTFHTFSFVFFRLPSWCPASIHFSSSQLMNDATYSYFWCRNLSCDKLLSDQKRLFLFSLSTWFWLLCHGNWLSTPIFIYNFSFTWFLITKFGSPIE